MTKNNQQGISALLVPVAVLVIVGIAAVAIYEHNSRTNEKSITTKVSKSVGVSPKQPVNNEYSGWNQFENDEYGISFKYPSTWTVQDVGSTDSGLDPSEYSANLKLVSGEKYSETASFEIHTKPIDDISNLYLEMNESPTASIKKTENITKGRQSVQFLVENGGVTSKYYLFTVGASTYSFSTINEELNIQKSSNYMNDFDKVFNSLVLK